MSDYIPEDCWPEILKRLPVKSLARFCCVCRQWNALICTSSFISDHHSCSKARPLFFIDSVFRRPSKHKWCVVFDSDSDSHDQHDATFIPHIITAQIPVLKDLRLYEFVGSAKGIICYHVHKHNYPSYINERWEILLWNPVANKYIKLPEANTRSTSYQDRASIAIGVKPSEENDLRVLRYFTCPSGSNLVPVVAAEIYSVGQGAWQSLQGNIPRCKIYDSGVVYNGNGDVHWVAEDDARSYQLIRFGFEEEEFSCINLPDVLADSGRSYLHVAVCFGRLALIQDSPEDWKIWTRDDRYGNAADSWSVITCIDHSDTFCSVHGITHDGQILMSGRDYREDGVLVLYDLTSRSYRQLDIRAPSSWVSACPFVESLIFMDGEGGALTLPQENLLCDQDGPVVGGYGGESLIFRQVLEDDHWRPSFI